VTGAGSVVGPERAVSGWIDAHCHLQDRYRGEGEPGGGPSSLAEAAAEATAAGVTGVVCVGTDAASSGEAVRVAIALREQPGAPAAWATLGLHPHESGAGVDEVAEMLEREVAEHPEVVVGVGECGLDYHYDHAPRAAQRDAFARQIGLARALRRTLVIHTRSAWEDTFAILEAEGVPERTVLHCFTGGPAEARRCLDLGAYLSFSGIVTFKSAEDVRDAARLCPPERLLVETDAPFLAPVPHRGKTNRPAWVRVVGESVAAIRGEDPADLAATSAAATRAAFGLD
jgi:TatD DNase family protein